VVEADDGRAIWKIRIVGVDYEHRFTMLKFRTHQVFHPSRRPATFEGEIEVLCGDEAVPDTDNTVMSDPVLNEHLEPTADLAQTQSAITVDPEEVPQQQETTDKSSKSAPERLPKKSGPIETPASIESELIGKHFLQWVRSGLKDGRLMNAVSLIAQKTRSTGG
jgi:hypothetical protein